MITINDKGLIPSEHIPLYSGVVSAGLGYLSLERLLTHTITKAAVFQEYLSRSPELTEQVLQVARETSAKTTSGDVLSGLVLAAAAGFAMSVSIYTSIRNNKD